MLKMPFGHHNTLSDVINNFTPNWFAMTMGTGITAICLNNLQVWFAPVNMVATWIWLFNIILFSLFSLVFILRGTFMPSSWQRMLNHSSQSMFLGCIPMGLATIINGFIFFGAPIIGHSALDIALVLWWIDVALSVLCCLAVPYFMFHHHKHDLTNMTAVWLLPIVACEVAAASGGLLIPHLTNNAFGILVTSIVLWSVSVSLALGILVIFFWRLSVHKMPGVEMAASIWLPLGPTATGSLAMLLLGSSMPHLDVTNLSPQIFGLLRILPGIGLFIGIVLWALASWWLMIALIGTLHYLYSASIKFNLGFWGYTFPLGVYIMASINLARQTGFPLLMNYALILSACLFVIWLLIAIRTLHGAYHGYLIKDPTLIN